MAKGYYGSMCLTDILEKAKQKHEAFSKASNGKIYFNVNLWVNDEVDKFDNVGSIKLDKETYIGNFKESKVKAPEPIDPFEIIDESALPF